ncbi:MAG: sugar phosphate isomerase/epimerase [Planctomycetaceae bacterium]
MTLNLAVATEDFGQPLRQAIELAAKNKVQGLRLNARTEIRAQDFSDTALRQLKHYITEHQMKVAGLMYSTRNAIYEQEHLDQRLNGIRSAMTQVRKLGTSDLLIRIGRIPDPKSGAPAESPNGQSNDDVDSLRNPFSFAPDKRDSMPASTSDAQKFQLLCDILNDLSCDGNRNGVTLQLQFSSLDPQRIQTLLQHVKGGAVGVVFDPAACVMSGSLPVRVFRDLYGQIGYIRLRDAQKDIDGAGIEVPLGDGSVDWAELLPTIVEASLPGWVCVERTGGDQRGEDVRDAVKKIDRLLPAAGS